MTIDYSLFFQKSIDFLISFFFHLAVKKFPRKSKEQNDNGGKSDKHSSSIKLEKTNRKRVPNGTNTLTTSSETQESLKQDTDNDLDYESDFELFKFIYQSVQDKCPRDTLGRSPFDLPIDKNFKNLISDLHVKSVLQLSLRQKRV